MNKLKIIRGVLRHGLIEIERKGLKQLQRQKRRGGERSLAKEII